MSRNLFCIWSELEVEADVFGGFGVEELFNCTIDSIRKLCDALVRAFVVFASDKRDDVTVFGFDTGTVAVFFLSVATVDASGALEFTESIANSLIATAQDPVDDLALVHSVEIIESEIIMELHGFENVGVELHNGAGVVATSIFKER